MSQPVVPLTIPQSRRFEKKSRNDILMKIRLGKRKSHSSNLSTLEVMGNNLG